MDKVKLFRSLFRGREDVYPQRFEIRKTGRAGYSPACANEWVRGVCEKPRIECSDCPHQRWLPVTDETVTWHLSGKDALLQENAYFVLRFLAADLTLHLDSILDTVLRTLAHRRRRKIESK